MLDSLNDAQQENNTGSAGWFDRLTTAINGVLPSSAPVPPPGADTSICRHRRRRGYTTSGRRDRRAAQQPGFLTEGLLYRPDSLSQLARLPDMIGRPSPKVADREVQAKVMEDRRTPLPGRRWAIGADHDALAV